ncbi:MAG: CHAD domain-containing protein [Acidobacteriaceae bacterium]
MRDENQDLSRLAATLRENLAKCAQDPDVDPVHDTRTGTRRLQATLESLVRELPSGDAGQAVRDAATATMQTLKRIRRAAAPVRDLDVHRKLVSKLAKRAVEAAVCGRPDVLEAVQTGVRTTGVEQQADNLDAWLKHRRNNAAQELQAQASGLLAKFDKRLAALDAALRGQRGRRMRKKPPARVALDNFARLATEMQLLDASNLHDFRKGAKKARYVAELAASGDAEAAKVGETLKKLQDEIGDWHDWLVLAEEAHAALGEGGAELTDLVEAEREKHFVAAMKAAGKLGGRLMGEWLAANQIKSGPPRPGPLRAGPMRSGSL